MDKSAIQEIASMAKITQPKTFTPTLARHTSTELINIEQYQEARSRFRGTLRTQSIDDFCFYATTQSQAAVFINAADMEAKAFFNLGDEKQPGHGDYNAELRLKTTAPFRQLHMIIGNKMNQKTAAEWIIDWRDHLVAVDESDNPIESISNVIAAIRNIKITANRSSEHTEGNLKSSRSALEDIEASSKHQIPAGFKFTCTPYEGLSSREFYLRLSIHTTGDAPTIKLNVTMLEAAEEAMANEFKELLEVKLTEDSVDVIVGEFFIGK